MAAILLIVIGAFFALSLNTGNIMHTRTAVQLAADSAALAGAYSLNGAASGLTAARNAAASFATSHSLSKDTVALDPATDVITGIWSLSQRTFTPSTNATLVNAVRVQLGRDNTGTHNSPLPVYFSFFLGNQTSVSVPGSAVAVGGGPGVGCSIPMALAECSVRSGPGGALACAETLVLADSNNDNVGWTNLDPTDRRAVSTDGIVDLLNGTSKVPGCTTDPSTGLPCCPVSAGDEIDISNGNNLNKKVADAFYTPTNGPSGGYVCSGSGSCPTLVMPVVDVPCSGGNPQFTGTNAIVGFVSVQLTSVDSKPRSVKVKIQCDLTSTSSAGGTSFGMSARPRLVQ